MIRHLNVDCNEEIITLASSIVYGNRVEWCGSCYRPLELSLLRSRRFFYYDKKEVLPLIVFFCGGGFTEVNPNVWTPELTWYAKHGYAVASVYYSVTARTRFPMQLEDAKLAIRYLRAHANEFGIDVDRIIVMGESAGGYMCSLVGLTGKMREYDVGEYQDFSSEVQGVVTFYPVTDCDSFFKAQEVSPDLPDAAKYLALPKLVDDNSPPFMLLHGTNDSQVSLEQSQALYDALNKQGIRSEFLIVEGAEHADAPFYQPEIKQIILDFMDSITK